MDINMPDMDGIAATEQLSRRGPDRRGRDDVGPGRGRLPPPLDARRRPRVPRQAVQQRRAHRVDPAGLHPRAGQAEPDGRAAGAAPAHAGGGGAGARDDGERDGQVIAIFSPKGGVGRTTVAVNLAVAAATELGKSVVLDGRLVPVRRRRRPAQPEPEEQVDRGPGPGARGRRARVARHVRHQPLGRDPGPARPAVAGDGRADHAVRREAGPRGAPPRTTTSSIVDCTSWFNETTLAILDAADIVLTMLSLEITSIKNMRLFLEVADQLGYEQDKIKLVLNRADSSLGHPRRRRRELDRPQGRPHDRQRRPVASCTPSTGAYRSSSPTGRRRSPRTSSGWPRRSPASGSPSAREDARKAAQKKSLFSFR